MASFDELKRSAGILLHPTSLPGPEGIGTIGEPAYHFIDFLNQAGQSWWQVLPYGPTGYGNCPYLSFSSIAGNPLMIDLTLLEDKGWLELTGTSIKGGRRNKVDFESVIKLKERDLVKGYKGFLNKASELEKKVFADFRQKSANWLEDYTLFMAIKKEQGQKAWYEWPEDIRFRHKEQLAAAKEKLNEEMDFQAFLQFVFFLQWDEMKRRAGEEGVRLITDVPLYVAADSADVWADQEIFRLAGDGKPLLISGVPPDYFSDSGQVWGSPVYNWDVLAERGFDWWKRRIKLNLENTDLLRIDHFRGLESFWAIPHGEKTGKNGKWLPARGEEMLKVLKEELGGLPFIAEDLGDITEEVLALRDRFGLPGMLITQFGFGDDTGSAHAIHNHTHNAVAYTGTHDNETLKEWLDGLGSKDLLRLKKYCGCNKDLHDQIMRLTLMSVSKICIIPMQDYLRLDKEGRMNRPGEADGNWDWRMEASALDPDKAGMIREICRHYGRC